ncbi:MAG: imidazolonepropionase [Bacteroidota bacterium]|jgi:imidazolonepropionase|nr:imidazolonepropionase [Bacteroidota bacterium]
MMDLVFYNISQLVTVAADGAKRKEGAAMREIGLIEDGAVGIRDGRIEYVGPSDGIDIAKAARSINAFGKTILPGFVDSHTHLVFGGAREQEFARRIAGATYAEIAAAGGGINTTVKATRAASKVELTEYALHRLDSCLGFGSTTVEIKSGYGLDFDNEIKMLEVINELQHLHVVEIVPTFLGAHTIPFDYKERREEYLELVLDRMLPEIATRQLAEYCDVFVERGAFTIEEARTIFMRARELGLKARVHADQITAGGGAELAADMFAASADHLDHISDDGIARMRGSNTVATLLPGVSLFLGEDFPDARRLIDAGLAVAIATDANPGSCTSENIQLMMSLAAMRMRMTMEEIITAVTLNAAAALDRSDMLGSIEEGKQADLLMFDTPNFQRIIYHFGVNHLNTVVKHGRVVMEKSYAPA